MSVLNGVLIAATSSTNNVPAEPKADPAQAMAEAPNNGAPARVAAHEPAQQHSPAATGLRRCSP